MPQQRRRAPSQSRKTSSGVDEIDFSGVETRTLPDEGDYILEVVEAKKGIAESSGKPKVTFKFSIVGGDFDGSTLYRDISLQKKALWVLKKLLESMGTKVPSGPMKIDWKKLEGKQVGGSIVHEVYEGKPRPKIVEFFSPSELEEYEEAPEEVTAEEDEDEVELEDEV